MTEFIKKLTSNTPVFMIVIGVLVFIMSISGPITIGSFVLQIGDPVGRTILSIIGIVLLGTGLLFLIRDELTSKTRRGKDEVPDTVALQSGSAAGVKLDIQAQGNNDAPRKLYTFCGLFEETRNDDILQDFEMSRPGGNINAVYYLWADTYRAGQISAYVDLVENFLRISFVNNAGSYPSNIAIRSKCERALVNTGAKTNLTFEARIPHVSTHDKHLKKVSMAVRVVNGWLQHWEYADKPGEYIQFVVSDSEWKQFSLNLEGKNWFLFQADGNHYYGPNVADFQIISFVVFEIGSYNVPGRPGTGHGVLDIRRIKLGEPIKL